MSNKNILITGAKGFIGKNLTAHLKAIGYNNLMLYDVNSPDEDLEKFAKNDDFIFHLDGINRPKDASEFYEGNRDLTKTLLSLLLKNGNKAPVLLTSSVQAASENDYGKSKKAAETLCFAHAQNNNSNVFVFRLPGVFGKWCKPSYNSVVATFCHNIANNLPIEIHDESYTLPLVYIDDVINTFITTLLNPNEITLDKDNFSQLNCDIYTVNLKKLADTIYFFKSTRENLSTANMSNDFEKKLYSTYLSYLPEDEFSYPLKMNCDERGSFTEFLRTQKHGQISVNISKPGIVKGNHWHHSKNEKFLVVQGEGIIRFRKLNTDKIIEYKVSAQKLTVIDIPTGYTHNIENLGNCDMITIMWANEPFNPQNPDTFFEPV